MIRWWLEDRGKQGSGWQSGRSYICMQMNQEEQLGSETDHATQHSSTGNKASKPLNEKICGGWGSRRNSLLHSRVHWRDPQGPRTYANPPIQESAPEGPSLLVGSGASDWKLAKSWTSAIVPSHTPPPHTVPQHSDMWVAPPWRIPKALPLNYITGMSRQKQNGPNEKLQEKYS